MFVASIKMIGLTVVARVGQQRRIQDGFNSEAQHPEAGLLLAFGRPDILRHISRHVSRLAILMRIKNSCDVWTSQLLLRYETLPYLFSPVNLPAISPGRLSGPFSRPILSSGMLVS